MNPSIIKCRTLNSSLAIVMRSWLDGLECWPKLIWLPPPSWFGTVRIREFRGPQGPHNPDPIPRSLELALLMLFSFYFIQYFHFALVLLGCSFLARPFSFNNFLLLFLFEVCNKIKATWRAGGLVGRKRGHGRSREPGARSRELGPNGHGPRPQTRTWNAQL